MPYQITDRMMPGPVAGPQHAKAGTLRRVVRTAKALVSLTMKRAPKWAAGVVAVALVIPGPLDELVIFPALALYVGLRNRAEFASVAREAWSR